MRMGIKWKLHCVIEMQHGEYFLVSFEIWKIMNNIIIQPPLCKKKNQLNAPADDWNYIVQDF